MLIKRWIFYDIDEIEIRLPFYRSFSTFWNTFSGLCTQVYYSWAWVTQQTHQRWNLVENESWADVCLSTLFQRWQTTSKQRWQSYVDSMLMTQCYFNVDIKLKRKVQSTHVHRCWGSSIDTALSVFVVLRFTRKWLNNKTKLSFQV